MRTDLCVPSIGAFRTRFAFTRWTNIEGVLAKNRIPPVSYRYDHTSVVAYSFTFAGFGLDGIFVICPSISL
jgi:hypothetical protein